MKLSDKLLVEATESDLERVLTLLEVDYTDMSYNQKRDAVVANFTDLTGWYFNNRIYDFQIEEIIKIILTQAELDLLEEDYQEWVDLHMTYRTKAVAAAAGQGFTFSYDGNLLEPTVGTITGVVASGILAAQDITLSISVTGDDLQAARDAVLVGEVISKQQTDNPEGYNMNYNGVDDPAFQVSKFSNGFSWDTDNIYDYVALNDGNGNPQLISNLPFEDIYDYLQETWFKTVMLSNAIASYKEKYVHLRLDATRRMNISAKNELLNFKDYIDLMGDTEYGD